MTAHPKHDTKLTRPRMMGRILTGMVLTGCVGVGGYFIYQQKAHARDTTAAESAKHDRVAVVTTAAARRTFERTLVVQGNVEAKRFAMVAPRIPGPIEAIYVDEGDAVVARHGMRSRSRARRKCSRALAKAPSWKWALAR